MLMLLPDDESEAPYIFVDYSPVISNGEHNPKGGTSERGRERATQTRSLGAAIEFVLERGEGTDEGTNGQKGDDGRAFCKATSKIRR